MTTTMEARELSLPLELPPETAELQERGRRFVDEEIIPLEEEAEANGGRLPQEKIDRIKAASIEANLNGGQHSPEYGGQGWSLLDWTVVEEQYGRSTNGIYWHVPNAYNVFHNATPEQAERYLRPALRGELKDAYAVTEANAGSDPSRIESTAVRTDAGWRINGEKWFVTSGDVASVLIVMANVIDGADRLPTLFLVDADLPGIEFVDDPKFTHNYPEGHPTIRFTDVEVPEDAVVAGIGDGNDLAAGLVHRGAPGHRRPRRRRDDAPAGGVRRLGHPARAGRQPDLGLPGRLLPPRRLGGRRGGGATADADRGRSV